MRGADVRDGGCGLRVIACPVREVALHGQLSETLDLHVKLADWRYPRPSMIRSAGLSLSDPVSGAMLAEIGHLETKQGGDCADLYRQAGEASTPRS